MRRRAWCSPIWTIVAIVAVGLAACGGGGDDGDELTDADRSREVSVMTRNLYLGADLTPLFEADAAGLEKAVRAVYDEVMASEIPERLDVVATEIIDTRPDLVALQEAALWRRQPPGSTEPLEIYDFVRMLLDRIESRGAIYEVAATANGFSGGLPVAGIGVVTMQDRDVILVRSDSPVVVSSPESGTFDAKLTLDVAGAPIEVVRGWAAVEATAGGERFRFVATHLEAFDDVVRDRQQQELLAALDDGPTLLLGDLNSAAGGADPSTYDATLDAGFDDVWTVSRADLSGLTCCRSADLRSGELTERIDFVLFRGAFDAIAAEVVGAEAISHTPAGRWPSDHAGVVATVRVPASEASE